MWLPLLRDKIATLDGNPGEGAGTLLKLFGQAKPTISVSTLRRSAGIIRIDMNTSAVPILKQQKIVTLINLNLRAADISKVCAPTTPCFDVFDYSHNTEPRKYGTYGKNENRGISRAHRGPIQRQEPKLLQEWTRCSWDICARSMSVRL